MQLNRTQGWSGLEAEIYLGVSKDWEGMLGRPCSGMQNGAKKTKLIYSVWSVFLVGAPAPNAFVGVAGQVFVLIFENLWADHLDTRHLCDLIRVQNKFVISPVSLPWISSAVQNAAQAAGLKRWSNGDVLNRELEKLQQGTAFHFT